MSSSLVIPVGVLLAVALVEQESQPGPHPTMTVTYHPDAKRPYDPLEPLWMGEPPCARFPTHGEGTLRLGRDSEVTEPRLLKKERGDYSHLTSKTRLFATLLAEYVLSEQGRITHVHVLRSASDEFDSVVLGELESSLWEPATLEGRPVAVCVAFTARAHP
jgi:hypothetical protein